MPLNKKMDQGLFYQIKCSVKKKLIHVICNLDFIILMLLKLENLFVFYYSFQNFKFFIL